MSQFKKIKQDLLKKQKDSDQCIDAGILDLVTALNCLGFRTDSSCEGHLNEKGIFFPWVVVVVEDDSNIDYNNNEQVDNLHFLNLEKQYKLINLLSSFYEGRETAFNHRLITGIMPGCGTELMPMSGYSTSIIEDAKERSNIYNIYKTEIADFTIFLIDAID